MARIQPSKVLPRPMRKDDWPELGHSTLTMTLKAIDGDRKEEAKALAQLLWAEGQGIHHGFTNWLWGWFTFVGNKFGEENLYEGLRETMGGEGFFFDLYEYMGLEEFVQWMAEIFRAHGSGPEGLGDIVVRDEGDKYVIETDPCGSGGLMRRGDAYQGPRTAEPFNCLAVKNAYPWTWGKTNVAAYCCHCALWEILSIERFGYPIFVTNYPDDPWEPCQYIFYKDPDTIPGEYFTRLSKSKPTPTRAR